MSIAANLTEGSGTFATADERHFIMMIARGSVRACVPLLELARRRKLIDTGDHATLRRELKTIGRMSAGESDVRFAARARRGLSEKVLPSLQKRRFRVDLAIGGF